MNICFNFIARMLMNICFHSYLPILAVLYFYISLKCSRHEWRTVYATIIITETAVDEPSADRWVLVYESFWEVNFRKWVLLKVFLKHVLQSIVVYCVLGRCRNCRVPVWGETSLCKRCVNLQQCMKCHRHLEDKFFDDEQCICKACRKKQTSTPEDRTAFGGLAREVHIPTTSGDSDMAAFITNNTQHLREAIVDGITQHEWVYLFNMSNNMRFYYKLFSIVYSNC